MIIVSQDVCVDKPHKQVFDHLVERVRRNFSQDIKLEEILFVDDKENNTSAASALGLRSILFNRAKQSSVELLEMLKGYGITLQ